MASALGKPGSSGTSHRALEPRERYEVRLMRACLRHWPGTRGRWFFARMCQQRLRARPFVMKVEPGVFVPANIDDWVQLWCFMGEFPDGDPASKLSRRLLRPGDVVLDIGANVGLWGLGAARAVGPSGTVHEFEPVPEIFDRLVENFRYNGLDWVRCFRLGVSDHPGSATFFRDATGNSGRGALAVHHGLDTGIGVTLTTLDEHLTVNGVPRVDFVKVDVEGAELCVFRGGARMLSSPDAPVILYECSEVLTSPFGTTSAAIKRCLEAYGYATYRVEGDLLRRVPVDERHERIEDLFALTPRHFELHAALRERRAS